jgi:hypothetical protein
MQFNGTSSEASYKYSMLASVPLEADNHWHVSNILEICEKEAIVEGKNAVISAVKDELVECLTKNLQPSINALLKNGDET